MLCRRDNDSQGLYTLSSQMLQLMEALLTNKSPDWGPWVPGFYPTGGFASAEMLRGKLRRDAWNAVHHHWRQSTHTPAPLKEKATKADIEEYIKRCIPGMNTDRMRSARRGR